MYIKFYKIYSKSYIYIYIYIYKYVYLEEYTYKLQFIANVKNFQQMI